MHRGQVELLCDRKAPVEAFEELKETFPDLSKTFSDRFRNVSVSMHRRLDYSPLKEFVDEHYTQLKLLDSGYAYHLIDRRVSKGQGLKRVAEMLKINLKNVVALGDSDVDVPMFEVSGFSVAMANASEAVKRKARHMTSKGFGEGLWRLWTAGFCRRLQLRVASIN